MDDFCAQSVPKTVETHVLALFASVLALTTVKCSAFSVQDTSAQFAQSWCLDSGANRHICCSPGCFMQMQPLPVGEATVVEFGNSSTSPVLGVGQCLVEDLILDTVLYVPEASINLISLPILDKEGLHVLISDNKCSVYVNKDDIFDINKALCTGILNLNLNGLYEVTTQVAQSDSIPQSDSDHDDGHDYHEQELAVTEIPCLQDRIEFKNAVTGLMTIEMKPVCNMTTGQLISASKNSSKLISHEIVHRRLGHINGAHHKLMLKNQMATGIDTDMPVHLMPSSIECEGCVLGKLQNRKHSRIKGRLKRPRSGKGKPSQNAKGNKADESKPGPKREKFELVHIDLIGPMPVKSVWGG